jgi:uncharacterized protein YjbI with pentapeptide repeats
MSVDRSLVMRWRTDEGQERAKRVLEGLAGGRLSDDLGWGVVEGRLDLRGLPAPLPKRGNRREIDGWFVEELSESLVIRRASLVGLDMSGAQLESLRMFGSTVSDCVFDAARCQDWRLWGCQLRDSRFMGTDLRRSALGPWQDGRGNVYERVSFARADLRRFSCTAATFVDCDFANARLEKIDFQSSSFIRARFAGELREVIFWDHGFETGKPDPNPMRDVDFTHALFRDVEFRRLNLDSVRFPESENHLIVHNYRCVIERALDQLRKNDSLIGRLLRASLELRAKWIGPYQDVGVFALADFDEPGEAELATALLSRLDRECAESG